MKILLIGVLGFFAWSAFSNYIYVCKIKGLCNERVTMQISNMTPVAAYTVEQQKTTATEPSTAPKGMVIYFAFDKSNINANAITKNYFDESLAYLKQNEKASILITGHADAVGTTAYNQALGLQRAQSTQHYFEKNGIEAGKTLVSSKGESEPAENNNTNEGRSKNRRTVITFKK